MSVLWRGLALLALLIAPMGCGLTHPYPSKSFYVLPAPELEPRAETPKIMLTVPRAVVAPPFDSRALQYRVGETLYEPTYYQRWSADPGSLVSAAVSRSLVGTGGFVVLGEGPALGTHALMLGVTELYADVRDPRAPRAVLAMQATLVDEQGNVLMVRDARAETPASSDRPSDMVDAWGRGLGEITESLVAQLGASRAPARLGDS